MTPRLQVDPAALRIGGTQFDDHHSAISASLQSAHRSHADLQDTWKGSAADVMADLWDDHLPAAIRQAGHLAIHASNLRAAADRYTDTDSGNADAVDSAGTGLLNLDV